MLIVTAVIVLAIFVPVIANVLFVVTAALASVIVDIVAVVVVVAVTSQERGKI